MASFIRTSVGLVGGGISLAFFVLPICFSDCSMLRHLGFLLCTVSVIALLLSLFVIPTLLSYFGTHTPVLYFEDAGDSPIEEDAALFHDLGHGNDLFDQLPMLENLEEDSRGNIPSTSVEPQYVCTSSRTSVPLLHSRSLVRPRGSLRGPEGSRDLPTTSLLSNEQEEMWQLSNMLSKLDSPDTNFEIRGGPRVRWAQPREGRSQLQVKSKSNLPSADSPLDAPRD